MQFYTNKHDMLIDTSDDSEQVAVITGDEKKDCCDRIITSHLRKSSNFNQIGPH